MDEKQYLDNILDEIRSALTYYEEKTASSRFLFLNSNSDSSKLVCDLLKNILYRRYDNQKYNHFFGLIVLDILNILKNNADYLGVLAPFFQPGGDISRAIIINSFKLSLAIQTQQFGSTAENNVSFDIQRTNLAANDIEQALHDYSMQRKTACMFDREPESSKLAIAILNGALSFYGVIKPGNQAVAADALCFSLNIIQNNMGLIGSKLRRCLEDKPEFSLTQSPKHF